MTLVQPESRWRRLLTKQRVYQTVLSPTAHLFRQAQAREQPTRKIVKQLKAAGFTETQGKGSHTKWTHPSGATVVPTGHRTISPGVVRQVNQAIEDSQEK
ncbi:type II toxin-antitoxin system HicA family toxin [Mycobacterium sp. Y57]|uniref:type II toxin-antitoxin system HicA family toxin n=1 Tax=Mycolicibacterium xanthum TaxID=2796469 RepID=UPI001C852A8B|nr:type II toxin-antitoxin system HicA family toxin [Mycolicibacterium xanthum]MBX7435604.1 type II toxin-antitoxin system HicA family toxin [Mycolicibacterium xanthum]